MIYNQWAPKPNNQRSLFSTNSKLEEILRLQSQVSKHLSKSLRRDQVIEAVEVIL